ncbi:uncharacterized protein EI97DRAFT_63895 [Westerdykella ornata]|uniref:DUF2293 domain-containing protein n=1 Tax=Westerdykella ornata TaxID=318751 RepID=A0A6A6JG76_WESOR|nr:uncharacterized protein EI97DRAFT_63895 [Westerdykella ornata]KAF2275551.1 hypothetical protein EI97DRAFT_63895 [Westerdykella ornata]
MVRVIPTHKSAHGSSNLDRPRAARKKKPYKVVLEMVTQEKKKFHSIMAYSANAPPGYTFVPLGDRELTEYCKDQCRKQNFVAHIVSARPKPNSKGQNRRDGDRNILRIDTQRIGHHFPDEVVDKACQFLGYEWSHRGGFRKMRTNYETTALARSLHDHGERMFLHGQPATEKQTKDQIRSAILEVFPKIPEADLESIVNHAFEEGTNRVGNAKELTLARRVQLAVGAFIRHQYTNYDKDLKNGVSWVEARQKSQPISYAKLKEWRGEGDDRELEETFREVIVLDDDDDEDSDLSDDTSLTPNEREDSVEIISSRATGRELGPDTYPDISRGYERMPSSNIRGPATTYAPSPNGAHMLTAQAPATDHRGAYETTSRSTAALRSTYEPERVVRTAPPTRYFRDKDGCLYNVSLQDDSRDSCKKHPFVYVANVCSFNRLRITNPVH